MPTSKMTAFSLILGIWISNSFSLHWDIFSRLCPEQIVEVPELIRDIPIPVGCEVIDCCPGCPGPGYIDWKIRVDESLKNIVLHFKGLSGEQISKIKIEGNGKIDKKGKIFLGGGEITLRGIPANIEGKTPMGFFNSLEQVRKENAMDEMDLPDEADGEGAVEVLQYMGGFQVNQFRLRWALIPCFRPQNLVDRLKLVNNTTSDNTVVLMDYRQSGSCVDDNIVRTLANQNFTNIQSNGTCNSEIAVFSDDNAMAFDSPVTSWTDGTGDLHTINLQPVINVPVSIWANGPALATTSANDIANANLLYNQNNVGVQFTATITDISGNAAAIATVGTGCPTPATVGALQGSAWYTAGTLNAYYVNSAFTGVNCGADRNLNYIGTTANLGSLPHEFGHAYGLRPSGSGGHTNGMAGFGNNNIMWGGGPGTRNNFTVAQAFRINVDNTSMLNINGNRVGVTRGCLPNFTSNQCPALALDNLPH